ncbi:MAG: hypothetical protein NC202_06785, partial [Roseburia sp.]|nr:hypothetical protein [Roseburia sp.]
MKIKMKYLAAATSAVAAAFSLTATAAAYLDVPATKADLLNATADNWKLTIRSSYGVDYSEVETLRAVVEVTDPDLYASEKDGGFYSDGATEFTDFTGALSFGGAEWLQYSFDGLADTDYATETAEIRSLGGGSYLLTAYFDGAPEPSPLLTTLSIAEWGNRSPDYTLRLSSIGLYGAGDEPVIVFGEDGEQIADPPALPTVGEAADDADETAEEGPAETAAEEDEPAETAPAETTTGTA